MHVVQGHLAAVFSKRDGRELGFEGDLLASGCHSHAVECGHVNHVQVRGTVEGLEADCQGTFFRLGGSGGCKRKKEWQNQQ